ncbi:inorganic diphosphatase [Kitasatospora sp. NPDC127059]|uniref:inorganic diphosphatase n=1 Tax=unclassified Kitasatospora TaxID=2633591 RepID=UPI0036567867
MIETPQGSRNKYVMDFAAGRIRLDRTLFTATRYPTDYGYVEGTLSGDGEPLDALALGREPAVPGCVLTCRAVGMWVMRDERGPDQKILCVPARDPRYADLRDIGDLPEFDLLEITHFFQVYKALERGKAVEGSHWAGRDAAYAEITGSRARAAGTRFARPA